MKKQICIGIGTIGSFLIKLVGGWDSLMQTLLIFMIIDYVSGWTVAAVFQNSTKTQNGGLESKAGLKGLIKKCMILLLVVAMQCVDVALKCDYIRNAAIIGFAANELISIVENAKLMGIPMPKVVYKAIDVMNEKEKNYEQKY